MASEQAKRLINIVRSFTNSQKPYGASVSELPAAVDAELQEVREVLESLATFSRPLCWCPQGTEAEPHTETCQRTGRLMSNLETK
jgi:hypothetical protein